MNGIVMSVVLPHGCRMVIGYVAATLDGGKKNEVGY